MQLLEYFKELTLYPKNAEELKGLILQLAVQGKLTKKWREENPDVEPASILLERINDEKARLIKENKIKKEKPLPEISEEEIPNEIPAGWIWCRLGEIITLKSGQDLTPNEYSDIDQIGLPYITGASNLQNEEVIVSRWTNTPRSIAYEGDLLLTCKGSGVGKMGWLKEVEAHIARQIMAVNTIFSRLEFIKLFLDIKLKYFKKVANGLIPGIDRKTVLEIPFPLPPLEEQKAIVEVVNQLFTEVEQLEALTKVRIQIKADFVTSALNQLTQAAEQDTASKWAFLQRHFGTFFTEKSTIKKLREGILQLAVKGKLTHHWRSELKLKGVEVAPASVLLEKIKVEKDQLIKAGRIKKEKPLSEISEDEIPYELPEGWIWCRFSKITNWFSTGPFGTMLHKSDYVNNGIPVINPQQMVDGNIVPSINMQISNETKIRLARYVLKEGNIIIARRGEMGRCAIITKKEEGFLCGTGSFFMDLNHEINREFIYLLFQSEIIREYLIQASNGATMSNLNQTTLLNMIIPLPPIEEQKYMVQKVNTLMTLCDKLEQEIETHQTTQEEWMQRCLREIV